MPRTARASQGGYCYHVLNRGNGRRTVFHKQGDFQAFVHLLHDAGKRVPVRLLSYCLMPNHFHLCLWPREDGDLSVYMQWLLTAHVLRYIERNAVRAGLVRRVQEWRWCSAARLLGEQAAADDEDAHPIFDPGPVRRPDDWLAYVNQPQTEAEVERLRESLRRNRPYGSLRWMTRTARNLGLEASLRSFGHPRKKPAKPGKSST